MTKSTQLILAVLLLASVLSFSDNSGHRFINLPTKQPDLPFSNAVLAGNTLYIAGSIGLDPDTRTPPADLEKEIRIVMDGMKSTLAQANMTMEDVVWVQVFCPDLSLYDKFNSVYKTYFGTNFPARAFIGSGPLLRGGHFEVNAIAVKR
jgi:2-iminobutanoate/2-iminopropanoate deaminase